MLERVLSAVVFIPLVVFSIFETFSGGIVFLGVLLVCSWLTAHEYFDLVGDACSQGTRRVGMLAVTGTVSLLMCWAHHCGVPPLPSPERIPNSEMPSGR